MQPSSEKPQSFIKIILVPISAISPSFFNCLGELPPDQPSTGLDIAVLRGDVCFQSGAVIDGELFTFIDRAAETRIVLAGIFVVGIILK